MKKIKLTILGITTLLSAAWFPWLTMADAQLQSPTALYMEDGQLISHTVQVQVNREIYGSMAPRLTLYFNGAMGKDMPNELTFLPQEVIPKQMLHDNDGHSYEGTLLLFKLNKSENHKELPFAFYQTGIRVKPILSWCPSGPDDCAERKKQYAASEVGVYVGNITHAVIMAILFILIFIIAVGWLLNTFKYKDEEKAKADSFWGRFILLVCDMNAELSLSRSQMALWTLAIGGVVLIFGLTRLEVPVIPEQLVALMGMSIGTTIVSGATSKAPKRHNVGKPELIDLVMVQHEANDKRIANFSLAKVQLIFWTLLTLMLFTLKSLIEGELWDVPWELVVLMGMSQGGYLARNQLHKPPKDDSGGNQGE